jgi:D-alanyl-D-alanine carboxypeptidase (penicillin-binding protein 5/6)
VRGEELLFAFLIPFRNFFFLLCLFISFSKAFAHPETTAKAYILMNAHTGKILEEKNCHEKLPPASITKIATCLYTLNFYGDRLEDLVEADRDSVGSISTIAKKRANYSMPAWWLETDASHIGIKVGEKLPLYDLLLGMMVPSADDAANVIAQYLSGSIPQFMEDLNNYLQQLGLKDTRFMNPHGLHHPKHYTTAYDMAILTRKALESPLFRKIVMTKEFVRPKTNKQPETLYYQTNRLIRSGKYCYSKAIGVKTGYHSDAEHTLVAAATSGERTLIAVLMGVKERSLLFKEAKQLLEEAFSVPLLKKTIVKKGRQEFRLKVPRSSRAVIPYTEEEIFIEYYSNEEPILSYQIKWDPIALPVEKGQKIGSLRILDEKGSIVRSVPLFSEEELSLTFLQKWGTLQPFFDILASESMKRVLLTVLFCALVAFIVKAIGKK